MEKTPKYSRSKLHELAMICEYQFLLSLRLGEKPDLKYIIEHVMQQPLSQTDQFVRNIMVATVNNFDSIVNYLASCLDNEWEFDRLNLLNQAIMVLGYTEIVHLNLPKPVVINVCVKLAQKFSDEDAFKMINGILDTIEVDGSGN